MNRAKVYFAVEKIIWEYGEAYGHVFFPQNLIELKAKITELDTWGRSKDYSFLIAVYFTDDSYLAFIVAHEYGLLQFAPSLGETNTRLSYIVNPAGTENEIIPIYYMSSYTEPDTTRMLPLQQILEAVYHYVDYYQFPSFITFDDDEVNTQFVTVADN